MRALVTGAGGFVGKYLIDHLLANGDQVFGTTLFPATQELPISLEVCDVSNAEACRKLLVEQRPDVIYHLAGISFVPEAEDDFTKALVANVVGTSNIFRTAHLLDLKCKIICISSAEVYGKISAQDLPIKESTTLSPANNYSLSKAMAEMVAKRYGKLGRLSYVVMRPFNHIGPGQDSRFVASSFAQQLALITKKKIPAVISVGNLTAKRDFSDVKDIVRAYRLAATRGEGVYNLASGRAISIRSLLDMLIEISGQQVEIREDPGRLRAAEVPEIYGSYAKAKEELGWEPQIELRTTLESIYQDWLGRL